MAKWAMGLMLSVLAMSSVGCSAYLKEKAQELAEAGLERGKEVIKNELQQVLPKLEEKLTAIAEKKLLEREAKTNAEFDAALLKVAPTDQTTGAKAARIWKDFDADRDGHLSPVEIARLTAYIMVEGPKRVSDGGLTAEEWSATQKGTAGTAGTAALAAAAWYGLKRRKDSLAKKAQAAGSAPPPKDSPPEPAPVAAK